MPLLLAKYFLLLMLLNSCFACSYFTESKARLDNIEEPPTVYVPEVKLQRECPSVGDIFTLVSGNESQKLGESTPACFTVKRLQNEYSKVFTDEFICIYLTHVAIAYGDKVIFDIIYDKVHANRHFSDRTKQVLERYEILVDSEFNVFKNFMKCWLAENSPGSKNVCLQHRSIKGSPAKQEYYLLFYIQSEEG